ncbi:Uncharacterized protein SCF082_LOCUS8801, partial [Durusdinium trenchii]
EYTDGHAEGCTKIYDLWRHRRVTDKGPDFAPCSNPEYIHGVDTGEWAECCRSPLMHPDDEQGPMKNVLKLLVALGLRLLTAALVAADLGRCLTESAPIVASLVQAKATRRSTFVKP